jgi:hypothetical protein
MAVLIKRIWVHCGTAAFLFNADYADFGPRTGPRSD